MLGNLRLLALAGALAGAPLFGDGGAQHRVESDMYGTSGGNINDISRLFCCSGTLGSLVQDNSSRRFILSNNHVLGLSGKASIGDDVSNPGRIDNGCRVPPIVADLTAFAPLSSNVDAAIAELRGNAMNTAGEIMDIGTISSIVRAPQIGLAVQKSGRTTGHTTGSIGSVNTSVQVKYSFDCGSKRGTTYLFTNQIVINSSSFSAGGDSGSLIVSNDSCKQPVGLLFAGGKTSTIANPAAQVLTSVGAAMTPPSTLSFVGNSCAASSAAAISSQSVEGARAAKEQVENDWLSRPGVLGVGVGRSDENSASAAIVVYVRHGASPVLPAQARGFRVIRIATDEFVAEAGCCQTCSPSAKRK